MCNVKVSVCPVYSPLNLSEIRVSLSLRERERRCEKDVVRKKGFEIETNSFACRVAHKDFFTFANLAKDF